MGEPRPESGQEEEQKPPRRRLRPSVGVMPDSGVRRTGVGMNGSDATNLSARCGSAAGTDVLEASGAGGIRGREEAPGVE